MREGLIRDKLRLWGTILIVVAVLLLSGNLSLSAASLNSTSIRFNRMAGGVASNFRLTFTVPAGNSATEDKVIIHFPDDFTVATTNLTADGSSCGATSLPGTLSVTGDNTNSSKNITITGVTNLAASTTYCVDIDRTSTNDPITNPSAGIYAVDIETQDNANATIDETTIGARFVSDDQIVVSAIVPPSFSFVLDGNTTSFESNLDSDDVIHTTTRTVTITTNAPQGWIAWARDSNVGLSSASAGHTISSSSVGVNTTLASGSDGYILGVDVTDAASGGTAVADAAYAGTSADNDGAGLDTAFRQIASSDGTAAGDIITLIGKASIDPLTPAAGDYTDTWTVIGAGSF